MKKLLQIGIVLFFISKTSAQVGINTTSPNAQLDIKSSNQTTPANTDGILIPKIDAFPATNPTVAQNGMMVFLTQDVGANVKGFYYWDFAGLTWKNVGGNSSTSWGLSGNSITAADVFGTTNNQDIQIRRNSINAGIISTTRNAIGVNSLNPAGTGNYVNAIGDNSLASNTTGGQLNAFGSESLRSNTTGNFNNAFGDSAMRLNTIGNENNAFGAYAMEKNINGNFNNAFGTSALQNNQSGRFNSAFGHLTLANNLTGNLNIAIGATALANNFTGERNVAIGVDALIANSTGIRNTALGVLSLSTVTTGGNNIAIGYDSQVPSPTNSFQLSVANKLYGLNLDTATPKFGFNTAAPTQLVHLQKSVAADGGNDFMFFENTLAGGAGFQFKNANATTNLWQTFLSSAGEFKIGRAGVADFITIKNNQVVNFSNAIKVSNTTETATAVGAGGLRFDGTNIQFSDGAAWNNIGTVGPQGIAGPTGSQGIQGIQGIAGATNGWLLTGNTATATDFIGTNNDQDIRFKRNGINAGTIGLTKNSIGFNSLNPLGTGNYNNAFGDYSLANFTTGSLLNAVGSESLRYNTTGSSNNAFGDSTMKLNTSGNQNNAFGNNAMGFNTIGNLNSAFGFNALYKNDNGSRNTAFGNDALYNSTGNNNVGLGSSALSNLTAGDNNIGIGRLAQVTSASDSNQLSIGNSIYGLNIGTANVKIGIGTATPNGKLQFANENLARRIVLWEDANDDHEYSGIGKLLNVTDFHVGDTGNDFIYSAGTSATTSRELMRIKGNGNVGIGAPTPSALLHLNKSVAADGGNSFMLFENSSAGGGAGFQFKNANIASNLFQMFMSTAGDFKIGRDGLADYMTVKNGGNVGIGTASPDVKLTVAGGMAIANNATFAANADNFGITVGNNSYIFVNSDSATATARTLVLSNGLVIGQMLFLQSNTAGTTNFFELLEGTSNVDLAGTTLSFNGSDIVQLIWNGNDWILINFQNITP